MSQLKTKFIADLAVTTAKINAAAVTGGKIASDVALAGNPTTSTQTAGNDTTRIATTAFVQANILPRLLTSFSAASGGTVAATDTILEAFGKLENRTALNDAKVTYSAATARSDLIASSIVDGDTTHAPDGNSVFDALALKFNSSAFTDAAVTGKLITGYVSGAGVVAATDTILQAINKLNGNTAAAQADATQALADASAAQADATQALSDAAAAQSTANAALPSASFTDAAVTGKLITGFVSGAGTVAATDTILQAFNKLDGNVAGKQSSSLASAHILVGNGSGVATDVAMSGEASIANTGAVTLSNAAVIGKVITGYTSGAGTVAATDTILEAIQKLNGNEAALDTKVGHLVTLSGVSASADDPGTFTGTIIPDSSTVKGALQSLETAIGALPDPIVYKGTYNATTNSPALANADTGKTGYLYQVSVAGSQDFGAGSISFAVGDKVVNNGTTWDKWDMTDAVTSVNGQSGAVSLAIGDLSDVVISSPSAGQLLTYDSGTSKFINASPATAAVSTEEHPTLGAGDITAQYVDLAHAARGSSASVNSISLGVVGGLEQLKGVDYSVSLTGGAGGVTRITFLGDLATGGAAELVENDILLIKYSY